MLTVGEGNALSSEHNDVYKQKRVDCEITVTPR